MIINRSFNQAFYQTTIQPAGWYLLEYGLKKASASVSMLIIFLSPSEALKESTEDQNHKPYNINDRRNYYGQIKGTESTGWLLI